MSYHTNIFFLNLKNKIRSVLKKQIRVVQNHTIMSLIHNNNDIFYSNLIFMQISSKLSAYLSTQNNKLEISIEFKTDFY